MLYTASITIPANTPATAPSSVIVPVTYGVLASVSISFPPGAAALAHVAVLYHEHQIIPVTPGGSIAWDDYTLEWQEHIETLEPPYEYKVLGWNEDTDNPHTIPIRFNILPLARPPFARALSALRRTFAPVVDLTQPE